MCRIQSQLMGCIFAGFIHTRENKIPGHIPGYSRPHIDKIPGHFSHNFTTLTFPPAKTKARCAVFDPGFQSKGGNSPLSLINGGRDYKNLIFLARKCKLINYQLKL